MGSTEHNIDISKVLTLVAVGLYWKDDQGLYLGCNDIYAQLIGLEHPDQVQGKTDFEFYPKNEAVRLHQSDIEAARLKSSTTTIELITTAHLAKIEVLVNRAPLLSAHGIATGVVCTVSPLPSKHVTIYSEEIESAYSIAKQIIGEVDKGKTQVEYINAICDYFQCIIGLMPEHVYWQDKNNVFLGCNDLQAEHAGLKSREEIIGKTNYDMLWRDQAEILNEANRIVIETGVTYITEETATMTNGTRTYLSHKVPLRNKKEKIVGILGISIDITDRKKMTNELKLQKEKAEAASIAKSNFIANISHDIRTPITGMIGLIKSLKDNSEDERNQDNARILMDVTEELLHLLNGVIEVVRLEEGYAEPLCQAFSLETTITRSIRLYQAAAKNKSLEINFCIHPSIPDILFGNNTYLERILLNLLGNAIKFTREGQIIVSVEIVAKVDDTLHLQFIVEDTGIGIPDNKLEQVFENFHRLSPSQEGIYKGNGMGLYMVKKYVEAMKGRITVVSQEGIGSSFIVSLAFKVADPNSVVVENETDYGAMLDMAIRSAEAIGKNSNPVVNQKIERKHHLVDNFDVRDPLATILVVEDHVIAAETARLVLQDCECASDHAQTGKEALEKMKENEYDLVLMDLGLPDMSGIEITKRVRGNPDYDQVPIIALSGHMTPEQREKCIAAGMNDTFPKPLSVATLRKLLGTYVFPPDENDIEIPLTREDLEQFSAIDLKTINLTEGAALLGGRVNTAIEMLDKIIASFPEEIAAIDTCYQSKDIDGLYRVIHRMYGALCYCGVPRLRLMAKQLRDSLLARELVCLDDQLKELLQEMQRIIVERQNL